MLSGLRSLFTLPLLFTLFLIGLSGCTTTKLLFDRDKTAAACVKGTGPVPGAWSALYFSAEKDMMDKGIIEIDEHCNITYKEKPQDAAPKPTTN